MKTDFDAMKTSASDAIMTKKIGFEMVAQSQQSVKSINVAKVQQQPHQINNHMGSMQNAMSHVDQSSSNSKSFISNTNPPPLISVNQAPMIMQPMRRVQTIQLTPQTQQALLNVQSHIQTLSNRLQNKSLLSTISVHSDPSNAQYHKPFTLPPNINAMNDMEICQVLQRLFMEQQKILASGKLISSVPANEYTPNAPLHPPPIISNQANAKKKLSEPKPVVLVGGKDARAPASSTANTLSKLKVNHNRVAPLQPVCIVSPQQQQKPLLLATPPPAAPAPAPVPAPAPQPIVSQSQSSLLIATTTTTAAPTATPATTATETTKLEQSISAKMPMAQVKTPTAKPWLPLPVVNNSPKGQEAPAMLPFIEAEIPKTPTPTPLRVDTATKVIASEPSVPRSSL